MFRVIAAFVPGNNGSCNLQAVIWNSDNTDDNAAAGIQVSLNPSQIVHIDASEQESLNLQCGDHAKTLIGRSPSRG
jgi:hypothetical protein